MNESSRLRELENTSPSGEVFIFKPPDPQRVAIPEFSRQPVLPDIVKTLKHGKTAQGGGNADRRETGMPCCRVRPAVVHGV